MRLNTPKFLPGSSPKSTTIVPKTKKVPLGSISSLTVTPKTKKTSDKDPLINILKKSILINKNLEKINKSLIKNQNKKRIQSNRKKRKDEEDRLEGKALTGEKKSKEEGGQKKPSFLQRIQDFLGYTFLGWLFENTKKYLPRILEIINVLKPITKFLTNTFKLIGEALITFIDTGYDLIDKFGKWKSKNIDGTSFEKIFNPVIDNLETVANLTLIAAMISMTAKGGMGRNNRPRNPKGRNNRPRTGRNIRPRGVTGTRKDRLFRNPFRRKPSITGTRKDRFFRNPFRQKPKPTGTRGYRFRERLEKINPVRKRAPVTTGSGTTIQILKDRIKFLENRIKKLLTTIGDQTKRISDAALRRAPVIASELKKRADITFDAVKSAIQKGKFKANQLVELAKPLLGRIVSSGKAGLTSAKSLLRPLLKPLQTPIRSIPFIGALIDFGINTFIFGDSPGEAAFKAAFAGILGAIGGAAGSIAPGPGTFIGATLGGMLGDKIGGWIYNKTIGSGSGEEKKAGELELNQFNKGGTIEKSDSQISRKSKKDIKEVEKLKIKRLPTTYGKLNEIETVKKIFPTSIDPTEFQSPYNFIKNSTLIGKQVPFYGPLFNLFGKSLLGNTSTNYDIGMISVGIASLVGHIFKTGLKKEKSLYDIFQNLPQLIYNATERFLVSFSEKILNELEVQLELKSIYNSTLLKVDDKKDEPSGSTYGPQSIPTERDSASGADTSKSIPQIVNSDWSPVLNLIYKYEAGSGGYESMYPSTTLPGATKMTIAEVASKATGAVGAWQNMPRFLNERARAVGLDPNTALYNEENQEKIAIYLIGEGQANVTKEMAKNNPKEAMLRLSRVWAAIPKDDSGVSFYAGVGDNAAHIKPQQMYDAFEKLKGGGTPIKTPQPRSFKSLQEKTSYENGIIILIKREKEIVHTPINNNGMSIIRTSNNNSTLNPKKLESFMK